MPEGMMKRLVCRIGPSALEKTSEEGPSSCLATRLKEAKHLKLHYGQLGSTLGQRAGTLIHALFFLFLLFSCYWVAFLKCINSLCTAHSRI